MLQVLQLLGDVPLPVHQGLLADVGVRHLVLEGVGHLDVIPEHLVVADLQGADAGLFLLLGLDLRQDALAAVHDVPQAVHFLVVAVPDEAAFPDGEGRLVADGGADVGADLRQVLQLPGQLRQPAAGEGRQLFPQGGQPLNGGPEGHQVPAAGGAVDDAADEPLHVPQPRHGGDEFFSGNGVLHQRRHGGVALDDGGDTQQRPLQPAAEHPASHGGLGLVQHPEEGALLLLAPEGLRQLQIPPGGEIQLHEPALLVVVQVVDVGQVRLLGLVQIIQQAPQGHGRRRVVSGQAAEGLLSELAADVLLRLRQPEAAFAAVLHPAAEFLRQGVGEGLFRTGPVVEDGLRRGEPAQLVDDVLHPVGAVKGRQVGLAGGDVAEGHAGVLAVHVNATEDVGGLVLQAGGVDDGAGGHHPDDVPLHQPLGGGGVLHLLADGHLVALGDEPGDIGLAGVVGDAAHGHPLLLGLGVLAVVPGGEGQIQLPGGQLGVVGEHLVEVAQAEEQDGVRVVLLDLQVLFHHGGQFGQKGSPLFSFYRRMWNLELRDCVPWDAGFRHADGWADAPPISLLTLPKEKRAVHGPKRKNAFGRNFAPEVQSCYTGVGVRWCLRIYDDFLTGAAGCGTGLNTDSRGAGAAVNGLQNRI